MPVIAGIYATDLEFNERSSAFLGRAISKAGGETVTWLFVAEWNGNEVSNFFTVVVGGVEQPEWIDCENIAYRNGEDTWEVNYKIGPSSIHLYGPRMSNLRLDSVPLLSLEIPNKDSSYLPRLPRPIR